MSRIATESATKTVLRNCKLFVLRENLLPELTNLVCELKHLVV